MVKMNLPGVFLCLQEAGNYPQMPFLRGGCLRLQAEELHVLGGDPHSRCERDWPGQRLLTPEARAGDDSHAKRHTRLKESTVPLQAPQPEDNAGILIGVLIVAAVCVRYWRIAIPLILVAALTITVLGLIEGLAAFYRIIG
jgi:hypothetical protein